MALLRRGSRLPYVKAAPCLLPLLSSDFAQRSSFSHQKPGQQLHGCRRPGRGEGRKPYSLESDLGLEICNDRSRWGRRVPHPVLPPSRCGGLPGGGVSQPPGTCSLSRIRLLQVTKTWSAASRLTHPLAGVMGLLPGAGSPLGQADLQAAFGPWRRGHVVGAVASQGTCIPGGHWGHKQQADPGTKCTVRADGESLAAVTRAAGRLAPGSLHPIHTFLVRIRQPQHKVEHCTSEIQSSIFLKFH